MVDVVRKVVDVAVYEGDAQVLTLHLEHGEERPRVEVALVLHAQAPQGDVVHVQPREPPLEHGGGEQIHLGSEGPGQSKWDGARHSAPRAKSYKFSVTRLDLVILLHLLGALLRREEEVTVGLKVEVGHLLSVDVQRPLGLAQKVGAEQRHLDVLLQRELLPDARHRQRR